MAKITLDMKAMIESNTLALASVDHEKKPHCIAVAAVKVIDENKLLVSDNFMVETIDNLKSNDAVALIVWDDNQKAGFEFKGAAKYFAEGKWFDMIRDLPENEGLARKGAVLVSVKKIKELS